MNETVVSFCGCLKSSIISVKLNILYLWKLVDEIINNSRAIEILYLLDCLILLKTQRKKMSNLIIFNKNVIIYLFI